MNSKATLFFIILFSATLSGQRDMFDNPRTISVTGSAEIELQPDIVELEITIQEYSTTSYGKYSIAKVEEKLRLVLEKHHVDQSGFEFSNSNNNWYHWWVYRNRSSSQKTFNVTLDCETDMLSFVKDLDFKGVSNLRISNTSNKRIQELRKEVKISALIAAKEKARYLLESIEEELGKVIKIQEVKGPPQNNHWNQNFASNVVISKSSSSGDIAHVSSITLRYEVQVVFEIG